MLADDEKSRFAPGTGFGARCRTAPETGRRGTGIQKERGERGHGPDASRRESGQDRVHPERTRRGHARSQDIGLAGRRT
jgi:hypothetical protein